VAVVIIIHIYIKSPSYADLLLRGIVREIEIEISRSGVTGQTEMKSRIYDVPNQYPSPTWWILPHDNCLTTSMVNFIHFRLVKNDHRKADFGKDIISHLHVAHEGAQ
jgi:hypothetical protein